jgi:hypothetical protein
MKKPSFASAKSEMAEGSKFLRSFILGCPGFTQKDAEAGIKRANRYCDWMEELFFSGTNVREAAFLVAAMRTHVRDAEARLALLRKQQLRCPPGEFAPHDEKVPDGIVKNP